MKKHYIIPEMTARQVNFQMNICVNSVQGNLDLQLGVDEGDPI